MKNKNYINIILLFLLCILTSCGITEDADCKQQKTDESKCVRAFALYCANNKSLAECSGSLESIFFVGSLCKVGAACQSNSDEVVTEKIQPRTIK